MKKAADRSLRSKILVFAALPVAILLLLVCTMFIHELYTGLRDSSLQELGLTVGHAAQELERNNLEAVTVSRTMAIAQEKGFFGRRSESVQYAGRVLELYPQLTGAYFGYEPNADRQDREYLLEAGPAERQAADRTGRFLPYWYRDKQNPAVIRLTPLIDMETSFYYQGLKNRMLGLPETENITLAKELTTHYRAPKAGAGAGPAYMITEPYDYEGIFIVEQTFPVIIGGEFKGIAGVDRSLAQIDGFLNSLKTFRTADFILISSRGRIISATMAPGLKTKRIEDSPYLEILLPFYEGGAAGRMRTAVDPADGREYFYGSARTPTGGWTLVERVAVSEVFEPVWTILLRTVAVAGVGLILTLVILVWLANSVAYRLATAAGLASQVAGGDLTPRVEVTGRDETGILLAAIRTMILSLNGLIGQVKKSSIQLMSTATRISATAKTQEAMVVDFSSSTSEIAASIVEISATSRQLAQTMEEVAGMVNDTADLAETGRSSLTGMETTMTGLAEANRSISAKLTVITEKARNISTVVTTINKVADQTNLLSLNAAIEAEKSGEYGLGFSVVARELRRLADQTAVATLDIEKMVKEMQSSVSAGVMEVDKFTDQVRAGVAVVAEISSQLGSIIGQVQRLTPRFEAINEGMRAQSQGAQQISGAMVQLKEAADVTTASNKEFNQAAIELHDAVRGLREEVARFKIDS